MECWWIRSFFSQVKKISSLLSQGATLGSQIHHKYPYSCSQTQLARSDDTFSINKHRVFHRFIVYDVETNFEESLKFKPFA